MVYIGHGDNQMNKILVAGATGYLGKYIVENLIDRNIHTAALVRNSSNMYLC